MCFVPIVVSGSFLTLNNFGIHRKKGILIKMKERRSYQLWDLILAASRPLLQHSMTQESVPRAVWVSVQMRTRRHSLSRACRVWKVRITQRCALSTQRSLTAHHRPGQSQGLVFSETRSAGLGATCGELLQTRSRREPWQGQPSVFFQEGRRGPRGPLDRSWGHLCVWRGRAPRGHTLLL